MRRRSAAAVFVGVVALSSVAAFAQEGRKLTGVVESRVSRRPVVDALVSYADQQGGEMQTTRTDSKGRFEFPRAVSGIVTVSARGYATTKRSWPPRQGRELRFELTPPAVLTGSLVDAATRAGVEGRVTVLTRSRFHHVSKSARVRGAFQFIDLPAGPTNVYAYAEKFAPYFGQMTIDAGKTKNLQISLLLEAVVSGTVRDADGSPAADADVRVGYGRSLPGADVLAGLARGFTVAGQEGEFRISGLLPDTPILLQAELDGRLSDVVTVQVVPGTERTGVILQMRR